MQYIRYLHIRNFGRGKGGYFGGKSFWDDDRSGVSIIELECVYRKSGSPCSHATAFYGDITNPPPVLFITIGENELPTHSGIVHSPTDDPCHFNVQISDQEEADTFIRKITNCVLGRVQSCGSDGPHSIGIDQLKELRTAFNERE